MSKSATGANHSDRPARSDPKVIRKKIMRAKTDSQPAVDFSQLGAGIQNLLAIFQAFSDWDDEASCAAISTASATAIPRRKSPRSSWPRLEPIQQRFREITADAGYVAGVLRSSAERVTPIANSTIELVKQRMGLYTESAARAIPPRPPATHRSNSGPADMASGPVSLTSYMPASSRQPQLPAAVAGPDGERDGRLALFSRHLQPPARAHPQRAGRRVRGGPAGSAAILHRPAGRRDQRPAQPPQGHDLRRPRPRRRRARDAGGKRLRTHLGHLSAAGVRRASCGASSSPAAAPSSPTSRATARKRSLPTRSAPPRGASTSPSAPSSAA